jgi:hypothetical protein
MAGRVQIASFGALGDSLSINPSFSFFTKRYSKYANYASENHSISFPERVYTGKLLDVPIPQKYGDILQEITLSFVVEPGDVEKLGSNLYPIDIFGISVIDYIDLYIGDHKIDTVTSDDIFIERELNLPESYRSSIDVLHGKHFQGSSDSEFLQEFYDGQYSTEGLDPFTTNEYRIHIPFYFHRRPAHGFPLCSVYEQEMSLRIKLRSAIDVIFATQEKLGQTLWNPDVNNNLTGQLELSNFKVNLELVHLNTTERSMLRNKPMDIIFEQRQRNEFTIEPESKTGTFNLDLKNCVKELFFIAKKSGKWSDADISILDELQKLDDYTTSQKTQLIILKLIPVWGGLAITALDSLVGETDGDERTSIINALLKMIYWGQTTPYVGYLEDLKDPAINIDVQTSHIEKLKTYIANIPIEVFTSQVIATSNLNALIGQTNESTRTSIVNTLLAIQNIWGEEQVGILQLLKNPEVDQEELLIFGLQTHLTTASYYLSGMYDFKPGDVDQVTTVNKLTEFLDNTKFDFDIIKLGLKAVLDTIPGKNEYIRARIVKGLIKGGGATLWGEPQLDQLESLRTVPGNDQQAIIDQTAVITSLKRFIDGVYTQLNGVKEIVDVALTNLEGQTDEDIREGIVNDLLVIPGFWSATEEGYLNTLKEVGLPNESTLISNLRTYTNSQVSGLKEIVDQALNSLAGLNHGPTRVGIVDGLLAIPDFWTTTEVGYLGTLKDPLFPVGTPQEAQLILALRVYTNARATGVQYLREGILDVIDDFPGTTLEERVARVGVLRQVPIWGDDIIKLVIGHVTNDATSISTLSGYLQMVLGAIPTLKYRLNALKGGINGILDTLPTTTEEREAIMLGIASSHPWSDEAFFYINALRTPSLADNTYIIALKQKGSEENVPNMTGYTQFDQNNVIDGIITQNVWGEKYPDLEALRLIAPGSANHAGYVDTITTHLTNLSTTIYGLLTDLQTPGTTSTVLQNTNLRIAAWGGYFYYLLEALQIPNPDPATESGIITLLKRYVNTTSLTDSRNNNLKLLITQLTVAYPKSIFNKWVRAKKHVPLMYSKQKTTTLECDGVQILDKTIGSNMFLSASLPNLYHKRSPNFRNINVYSFALYPGDLRPSGHLNFSTIKDARVTMELEYDGAHGTFDFDDNYIELFGIEPIYFPKQVIIIAKSYNMMIIRNGKAQIIY